MTNDQYLKDTELEALFAVVVDQVPEPSSALTARILADADMIASAQSEAKKVRAAPARQNWFDGFLRAVGGWPAVGGLVTATVVGVWIGYAPPAAFDGIAETYLATDTGYDLIDFMPTYEAVMDEG